MSYPLNACVFMYYLCMRCYRYCCAFLLRCTERICSLCMRPPYTSCRANSSLKRVILSFLMTWAILLICVCIGYWAFVLASGDFFWAKCINLGCIECHCNFRRNALFLGVLIAIVILDELHYSGCFICHCIGVFDSCIKGRFCSFLIGCFPSLLSEQIL